MWPDTSAKTAVRASRDCFVRVAGADYSVPPAFISRMLDVRLTLIEVVVFCEGREIVRHARSFVPADVVVAPGHAEQLANARRAKQLFAPVTSPCRPSTCLSMMRCAGWSEVSDVTSEIAFYARALRAPRIAETAASLADRARDEGWEHERYLAAVLDAEVCARACHGGENRVKAARFPQTKTLDDFDFAFQVRSSGRSSLTWPSSISSPSTRTWCS